MAMATATTTLKWGRGATRYLNVQWQCHKSKCMPHATSRMPTDVSSVLHPHTHTLTHTPSMRRKNAQTVSMQLSDWRATSLPTYLPSPPPYSPHPTCARRGAKPLESFLRLLLEPSYYYCSCCCDRRRRRRAICYTLFSLDAFPFSGIFLNIYYSSRPPSAWTGNWAMRKYHTKHSRERDEGEYTVKYWRNKRKHSPTSSSSFYSSSTASFL